MVKDNAEQVLFQVREHFRSTLHVDESGLFAFQLLVWAHLSAKGRFDPDTALDAAMVQGSVGVQSALSRLALQEGAVGMAFYSAARYAQQANDAIFMALKTVKYLVEGGVFDRFSPVDVAGELVGSTTRGLAVPPELPELMKGIAINAETQSAYLPWESSGQVIGALMDRPGLSLHVEAKEASPVTALLSLFREAPTEVVLCHALRAPSAVRGGHLSKFDASLSIIPVGVSGNVDEVVKQDIYNRFPVSRASVSGLMVQHIAAQTDGIAAIVVPNSFLFATGRDREVREYLLKQGWVEAVVALPQGLFQSSALSTALLVLNMQARHRSIGFLDASKPYFHEAIGRGRVMLKNTDIIQAFCNQLSGEGSTQTEGRQERLDSIAAIISVDEVFANNYTLDVGRYVIPAEQREAQARMASLPTETLEDVVSILNPVPIRDRSGDSPESIEVFEVGAADLPTAGYIPRPEKTVRVKLTARRSGHPHDIFLRPHDLVLVVKGSTGKVGIVPENVPPPGEGGWIIGQSFVVLRAAKQDVDLRGLGLWLRSKTGQQVLEGIKTGATIPMMSISTLRKLKVIALNPLVTAAAAEILERENELQWQIENLQLEQAEIAEDFWKELLEELQQAHKDQKTQ